MKCLHSRTERNERGRRVEVLISDFSHRLMVKCVRVNTRILMVKFKSEKVKLCVVVYIPSDRDYEENETFQNDVKVDLDRESEGFRITMLGDLNG